MSNVIKSLSIEGFKSIRQLRNFELKPINVLIGPNGAGKTNFISFFRFLREMIDERLQVAVQRGGGADAFLYMGPKITNKISVSTRFGSNGYDFTLVPTVDGRLIFEFEKTFYFGGAFGPTERTIGSGNSEAQISALKDSPGVNAPHGVPYYVYEAVSSWVVYHFHDTSESSAVRRAGNVTDNETLRADASNLAAFLYRIQQTHPEHYRKIVDVVRLAAPFFGDFRLRPNPANPESIQLEWFQKDSDYPFLPSQLSDGTLRFICLATALLQPKLPSTTLFDEPELGLHPYALVLLGKLLRGATTHPIYGYQTNQVIISTQSAMLLNEFLPDEVIIVERADGQSVFNRLQSENLSEWLNDYSLGELWQKNVLGGRPRGETGHLLEAGLN
jgi:predicted ATPase